MENKTSAKKPQNETESVKALLKKWDTLSLNLKKVSATAKVVLPDVLLRLQNGSNVESILRSLSEFFYDRPNLMEFCGDKRFLPFFLDYCEPGARFDNLFRFQDALRNAAGFHSHFKGIVYVDIREWIGHEEEKSFQSFLVFLAAHSHEWLIVMAIPDSNDASVLAMQATLAMFLRLETVRIRAPRTAELMESLREGLLKYDLELTEDGVELLQRSVDVLRKNKFFDGVDSIRHLQKDIVYNVYSRPRFSGGALTAKMLSDFGPDSEYIRRISASFSGRGKIGFA